MCTQMFKMVLGKRIVCVNESASISTLRSNDDVCYKPNGYESCYKSNSNG